MDFVDFQFKIIFQLVLASLLGGLLGLEREYMGKVAGIRTFALVSLGSSLFAILSKEGFNEFLGISSFDPSRIASQVVVGIGFIGAGVIIHHGFKVVGITTAAGLWLSAALGLAVGLEFYLAALFTSFLSLFILFVVGRHSIKKD